MSLYFNGGSISAGRGGGSDDTYTKAEINGLLSAKSNTGLDNLNADGQMIIDSQNRTISNCILEIPQNLKLEISGDTLTVKSGSIITLTGNTYATSTVVGDKTVDYSSILPIVANGKYYLFSGPDGVINPSSWAPLNKVYSGDSLPDGSQYSNGAIFFLTTDKNRYYNNNGAWIQAGTTYPLGIVEVNNHQLSFAKDSNGNDMIFNGAGFIGHHAFVYPNVKALIPNGFNDDGSLKSELWEANQLLIRALETNVTNYGFMLQYTSPYLNYSNRTFWQYSNEQNKFIHNQNSILFTELANFSVDSNNVVTDFTIRQPYEGCRDLTTDNKQDLLTTITGYDSTKTQTLKNVAGTLTWVDD